MKKAEHVAPKKHDEPVKHEAPKHEVPKHEDPKDKKIRRMTELLTYFKENVVQGNTAHVASIESVLRD
jgi:hypothetical protein